MTTTRIDILLIEDNPGDAELVRQSLAKARLRFASCHATRLTDGLEHLQRQRFDVLLLDLSLPDSDGLESLGLIRALAPELPVVVLTALASDQLAEAALDAGAQDYLIKDRVTPEVLERTIDYAIHRQQSHELAENLLAKVRANHALLERKNRKLEKLYKLANRFVDNVSHEFRTPLTVITEFVSLIRDGVVGAVSDKQASMLDTIGDRADDLSNMVDDMLDISKLEAGVLGIYRRNARVADIIRHVRPALERKAALRQVSLEFSLGDDLPEIYCDPDKVCRVIINLATNAIKFSGEPGNVRIWVRRDASQDVTFGITDNGPGIDEAGIAVIFRRFKQLGGNMRGSSKGFGLGLNIAKELVELNFGRMGVKSAPGKGSTFSFSVPLAEPTEVMKRYLRRLENKRNGASVVSLVSANIDSPVSLAVAEDAEAFLNYLLRRNDLLFSIEPRRWLAVLAADAEELETFLARAAKARMKVNRNRPHGPLPEVEFQREGTWRVVEEAASILARTSELIDANKAFYPEIVNCAAL